MNESERVLYNVPFFQVPNELVKDKRATVYHIAVFAVIAMHANTARRAWPSISRIASLSGCSRRKAQDTVSELEVFGWIKKERRWDDDSGQFRSNIYELQPSLQSGAHCAPGVVQEVHQGSAGGAQEQYPLNNTHSEQAAKAVATKKSPAPLRDEFANRWELSFTAKVPMSAWSSIPRGRKACNDLGKKLVALSHDTGIPEDELARKLLDTYQHMCKTQKGSYWSTATFTPSEFLMRWDKVVGELNKEAIEDESASRTLEWLGYE